MTTLCFLFLSGVAAASPGVKIEVIVSCDGADPESCVCTLPGDLCDDDCPINDPHLLANYGDDLHQCLAAVLPFPPPI